MGGPHPGSGQQGLLPRCSQGMDAPDNACERRQKIRGTWRVQAFLASLLFEREAARQGKGTVWPRLPGEQPWAGWPHCWHRQLGGCGVREGGHGVERVAPTRWQEAARDLSDLSPRPSELITSPTSWNVQCGWIFCRKQWRSWALWPVSIPAETEAEQICKSKESEDARSEVRDGSESWEGLLATAVRAVWPVGPAGTGPLADQLFQKPVKTCEMRKKKLMDLKHKKYKIESNTF